MLNHLPVVGVIIGFFVLLAAEIWRSRLFSLVGSLLLISGAIIALPVYFTGLSSEEAVEGLPGVTEISIDQHEGAALISLGLAILAGVFAAACLVFYRRSWVSLRGYLVTATLLIALLAGTSMFRTANLGGQIRHTEIHPTGSLDGPDNGRPKETRHHDADNDER